MKHEITRSLTEWCCICGRSGVIVSEDTTTFACLPVTEADKNTVNITLNFQDVMALSRMISMARREFESEARMWSKLASDPAIPNASKNAMACAEEADVAVRMENLLLQARIS
jgi:hypothetical protein